MSDVSHEYWDLGEMPSESQQWPSYNPTCLGKITYALMELKGKMLYYQVDAVPAGSRTPITMRIELPYGQKEAFESMTGFPLTKIPEIGIGI